MQGYIILVTGDDGRVHFVGRRDSMASLIEDVELYRRDPIAAGSFFGVHIDAKSRVSWSDDWCAVVDASLAGHIDRVFHPGHGDPYAQYEEYFLPERLTSLEAARAA